MNIKMLILPALLFLFSCAEQAKKQTLLKTKPLAKENVPTGSDLCATTDEDISANKTYIYTPTLLFAWQEIETKFPKLKIIEHPESAALKRLMLSDAHKNSLKPSEYKTEIEVLGQQIIAKASYELQLGFSPAFQKIKNGMIFNGVAVSGFGIKYYEEQLASKIEILYYRNDGHFIFSLRPNEDDQELIFIKGLQPASSFKEVLRLSDSLITIANKRDRSVEDYGIYTFQTDDQLFIPDLNFKLEKNFKEMLGQQFKNGTDSFKLEKVWQETALQLTNSGAVIESKAVIGLIAAKEDREPPVVPRKKNLILNNTFYIIGKHKNQPNPYFMMKVANADLMTKASNKQ